MIGSATPIFSFLPASVPEALEAVPLDVPADEHAVSVLAAASTTAAILIPNRLAIVIPFEFGTNCW
ncbi:MAG: hypothetical protein LCH96_18275 [Actinobacteria bacterium]|nr:hypothetical protein [Actinomycetota bacterium]